jgi:hypothetical protein
MRARMDAGESALGALVSEYLSGSHMQSLELGCPVGAVSSDMQRAGDALREVSQGRVRALARMVEGTLNPKTPPGSAWAIAASLVGAIQLARVLGAEEGNEVLQACREALLAQYDRPAAKA